MVSADGAAAALARAAGAGIIGDRGGGLNEALAEARAVILGASADAALLILPIDLPRASAASLRALSATLCRGGRGARPAGRRHQCALPLAGSRRHLDFRFGGGSFAAHRAAAESAGLSFAAYADPDLAFDIDSPDDLAEWRGAAPSAPAARRSPERRSFSR